MSGRARINDRDVKRALRELGRAGPKVTKAALQGVAFDVRDAEHDHVSSIFDGPRTSFLAKSFRFKVRALSTGAVAEIFPLKASALILKQHLEGRRKPFGPPGHLAIARDEVPLRAGRKRMRRNRMLAIPNPAVVKRGRSGKVSKRRTPQAIVGTGGRGFLSSDGGSIVERTSKRSKVLRVAYTLRRKATNPPVFRFFSVAKRTAERNVVRQARKALDRASTGVRA